MATKDHHGPGGCGFRAATHPLHGACPLGLPYLLAIFLTMAVVGLGWWQNTRNDRTARDVLIADEHAALRLEDKID